MSSSRRSPKRPSHYRPPVSSARNDRPSYGSFQRGSGSTLRSSLFVGLGILIAACVGLSFVVYQRSEACLSGSIRECLGLPTPTPSVTVGGVLTILADASDLVTARAESETRISVQQAETILGFETSRKIELEYQAYGTVMASIDLSKVREWDIQISSNVVIVNLPAPEILSVDIDVNRSYIANIEEPFLALNDPDPRLVDYAQEEAERVILEDACAKSILDQANIHAAQVIRELLVQVSPIPVQIITQPGVCR